MFEKLSVCFLSTFWLLLCPNRIPLLKNVSGFQIALCAFGMQLHQQFSSVWEQLLPLYWNVISLHINKKGRQTTSPALCSAALCVLVVTSVFISTFFSLQQVLPSSMYYKMDFLKFWYTCYSQTNFSYCFCIHSKKKCKVQETLRIYSHICVVSSLSISSL